MGALHYSGFHFHFNSKHVYGYAAGQTGLFILFDFITDDNFMASRCRGIELNEFPVNLQGQIWRLK